MMKKKILCLLIIMTVITSFAIPASNVQAERVKKAGYYYTLAQQKTPKAIIRINYGKLYLKKIRIKGNKIVDYGNFDYKKTLNKRKWKRLKPKKRVFRLANNCKYYNYSDKMSKREFLKDLKGLSKALDSCVSLIIRVKKGKVVEMKYDQPVKHRY